MQAASRAASGTKLVCFWIAGQRFAADLAHVRETIVLRPITRVFLTPHWIAGLINLRGDVVCVLDLAAFLGLGATRLGPETRILIARPGTKRAGLLCERLADVTEVDLETLQPPPPSLGSDAHALVRGLATLEGGAPLVVLDLVKLFDSDRLKQFQRKG